MEITDKHIQLALEDGREDIFEMIFRSWYSPLCAYACSYLNDRDEAEEVVQNAFVAVWERRSTLEINHSLKSYLYRAVRNASLNVLKHQKVRAAYAKEVEAFSAGSVHFAPGDGESGELGKKIESALLALPEQCRLIFKMSRFEELKYQEIAAELGISVKTVENQMGKALRIMREQLRDYLPLLLVLWQF